MTLSALKQYTNQCSYRPAIGYTVHCSTEPRISHFVAYLHTEFGLSRLSPIKNLIIINVVVNSHWSYHKASLFQYRFDLLPNYSCDPTNIRNVMHTDMNVQVNIWVSFCFATKNSQFIGNQNCANAYEFRVSKFYPAGGRSVVLSQENALHTRLHAARHVAQALHDPGHAGNRGDFLLFTLVSIYNGKDVQIILPSALCLRSKIFLVINNLHVLGYIRITWQRLLWKES